MRNCRVAHPRAVFPSLHACTHAIAVARPISFEDAVELVPIDRTDVVVPSRLVPFELRIWHRDAEVIGLRHRLIDEPLTELVVRQQLDLPPRRLGAMHALSIRRTE